MQVLYRREPDIRTFSQNPLKPNRAGLCVPCQGNQDSEGPAAASLLFSLEFAKCGKGVTAVLHQVEPPAYTPRVQIFASDNIACEFQ